MTAAFVKAASGFKLPAALTRFFREFEAFFEESGRALHRAHRDYPFGL